MTDNIKTLFENAGLTDEAMEEIAAQFRCSVDEQVMNELASSLTFMKETVQEELETAIDGYLNEVVIEPFEALAEEHSELVEAHNHLAEAFDHLFDLVTQGMSQEERERWYREVAQHVQGDATDYPWKGAPRMNDSIPDNSAEGNRNSLRPSGGVNYGTQGVHQNGGGRGIHESLDEGASPAVDPRIQKYVEHAERQAGLILPEPSNIVELYTKIAEREAADPFLASVRGGQGK
jgi:hypothetical protein